MQKIRIDRTGQRYGRLVVAGFGHVDSHGNAHWACVCDCGATKTVNGNSLTTGNTQSCGCRRRDSLQTHGMHRTAEYQAYHDARHRCTSPTNPHFAHYGGRGIRFLFESFEEMMADVGPKPAAHLTLDRIDNDGHYERGNVRWATRSEQNRNRRPRRRMVA